MSAIKLPNRAPKWVREASPEAQQKWLDEYRAKTRAAANARYQTPEGKAYSKAYSKAYQQTPEYKAGRKAYDKARRQTPEYKSYQKAYKQTPEYKSYQNARQQMPEYKAYQKAYKKAYYAAQRADKNSLAFFQAMNEMAEIQKAISAMEQTKTQNK